MLSKDHLFFKIDLKKIYEETLEEMKTNPLIVNIEGRLYRLKDHNLHTQTEKPSAIDIAKNSCSWHKNGKNHRSDGPAMIDLINKELEWYDNKKRHRIGGFAKIKAKDYEIYKLYLNEKEYVNPHDYVETAKNIILNKETHHALSTHDKFEIIEDLEEKLSIGYFNKNLWRHGHFIGKHTNIKIIKEKFIS